MREFHLHVEQALNLPRARVFAFFADAANLQAITPEFLHFRILTPPPIPMREGTLIDYAIRLHGLPIRWRTRIAVWEPERRFVDEQLRGPYRRWIHEHTFEALSPQSTLVRDHVRYAVPGGPALEALIERLIVRPRLDRIFAFRTQAIARLIETAR